VKLSFGQPCVDLASSEPAPATRSPRRPPHPADVVTVKASRFGPLVRVFTLPKLALEFIRLRKRVGVEYAYSMVDALFGTQFTSEMLIACAERYGLVYPVRRYLGHRRRLRLAS
jgi:hypothetical protein